MRNWRLLALWMLPCLAACAGSGGDDKPGGDADGDGFGVPLDCDDDNAQVNPDATELCDTLDNNCDGAVDEGGLVPFWPDADEDGYGVDTTPVMSCVAPAGYAAATGDCDDASPLVHPDAPESCNGVDDNCDGLSDDNVAAWFLDADADGYGDPATGVQTCLPDTGRVADGTDCDDTDPAVHPGAVEACDYDDDNCDGRVDQGVVQVWHSDDDGDGYGNPLSRDSTCDPQPGWMLDDSDCRPGDADAYPGAPERCNDDDDDCDQLVDEDFELDGDGYVSTECGGDDCDDLDPDVRPGGLELCEDGVDNDCDDGDAHCSFDGAQELAYADAKLYSGSPNFDAGERVDVGDLDGDGLDDIVVAVMYADGYNGGAYVILGAPTGIESLDSAGYRISGDTSTYSAGRSIGVGDVNGDGYEDLAIGAPDTTCREWIVFGPITADSDLADADVERIGDYDTEAGHGSDLADVDGDGVEDAVIGAYEDDAGGNNAGAIYVEYGPISAGSGDLADSSDARLIGEAAGAYAGRYMRAGGDVDGDGLGDILAAAPYATGSAPSSGSAYLVYGGVVGDLDLASADGKFLGEAAGDYASEGLAMGDFDGDGLADVVLGSWNSDGGYYAGAVYVVLGPATGTVDLGTADFIIRGTAGSQQLGIGPAVEDIDGDGAGELLVGAIGDASLGPAAGAAYLYFGPPSGTLTLADADAAFYGENAGDEMGLSVAIGDLDGDGQGDLVMGAPGEATGGSGAGAVYIEYAKP